MSPVHIEHSNFGYLMTRDRTQVFTLNITVAVSG
jgi:hypothetical protein